MEGGRSEFICMRQSVDMARTSADYVKAVECGLPPTQVIMHVKINVNRINIIDLFAIDYCKYRSSVLSLGFLMIYENTGLIARALRDS